MKVFKKILAGLTAFHLCIMQIPLSASAIQLKDSHETVYLASAQGSVRGFCGNDVSYWYDGDGTLTISGNDKITSIPWSYYKSEIRNVILDKGLINIPNEAFWGCSNLVSVSIPDSMKEIGTSAFYNCSSLISVSLPDSIQQIGKKCFLQCSLCRRCEWCVLSESVVCRQ